MDLTLLVTYGRSGSTLLMRVMRQHPKILVRAPFPFETRTAQYLFLASQADGLPPAHPLSHGGGTYLITGSNDTEFREIATEALKSDPFPLSMQRTYAWVAEHEGRPDATIIAEKALGQALVREMLDRHSSFRLVSLIRDPRTTVRSIRAFNRRRGFLSFGEEHGLASLLDRVISFNVHALQLVQRYEGRSLMVRYEELMSQPSKTVDDLLRLHGLPREQAAIGEMLSTWGYEDEVTREHRTSDPTEDTPDDIAVSPVQADRIVQLGY